MDKYPFYRAEYLDATLHLDPLEDITYRRLLDLYHEREAPIPLNTQWVARRIRMPLEDVKGVLEEFFEWRADGWHDQSGDDEIRRAKNRAANARNNGKLGGRPKGVSHG